jgi:hypothetical protein
MTKHRGKTAAELMAALNADSGYVSRQREQEEARLEREVESRRAESPLVDALANIGVHVRSVWDLVNTTRPYPKAVPTLLDHLQRPYPAGVTEGIARALAVPEARAAWGDLLRLFETDPDTTTSGVKWALGCALAAASTDDVVEDLVRLVEDRRHGGNRIALVRSLAKSDNPRARRALVEAAADPELAAEVQNALKYLRRRTVRERRKSHAATPVTSVTSAIALSEASTNLDSQLVGPFLERVSRLVEGLGAAEIARVLDLLSRLEVGEERELGFEVKHGGDMAPLLIRIFMDDIDAPDVQILTTRELANKIDELMQDFSKEHRI